MVALWPVALTTRNILVVPVGMESPADAVWRGMDRSEVAVSVMVVPAGTIDDGVPVPIWPWRSIVSPCTPDPLRAEEQFTNTVVAIEGGSTSYQYWVGAKAVM